MKKKSRFFEVNPDAVNSTKVIPFTEDDPRNKVSSRDYPEDCSNGKIEINEAHMIEENCNRETRMKDFNSSP